MLILIIIFALIVQRVNFVNKFLQSVSILPEIQ